MTTRNYRKFDEDFKQGAVALVAETGKPIAQVARELGVKEGTLGNWCARARDAAGAGNGELSETERAELARLRKENTELRMQRDVLIGHVEERVRARRSRRLVMS
jgi:transposase